MDSLISCDFDVSLRGLYQPLTYNGKSCILLPTKRECLSTQLNRVIVLSAVGPEHALPWITET